MEQFPDRQHVWLRSRVHGTYLRADEDGYGVSLSHRRASMNAAWSVHRYYGDGQHVLLHSAAYARYLAATTAWAPLGCRGFRVEQRSYEDIEDEAIRWHPIIVGPRAEILLRCAHDDDHYGYLRANGKYLRWNDDGVSVDDFDHISTMMQWVVVPIPSRERIPRIPRPTGLHFPGRLAVLLPSRVVEFMGIGEGCYADDVSFTFRGRCVFRLRNELARRLGISREASDNLVMFVRAGRFGRFTPLVVDLPRSRQTLVITADTPANGGPRYPDFDAELISRERPEQVS